MAKKIRPSKPTMPLYVRIDPVIHAQLVEHVKRSNLSRQQIVEGALVRMFVDADRAVADQLGLPAVSP